MEKNTNAAVTLATLASLMDDARESTTPTALLEAARRIETMARHLTADAVTEARRQGMTWEQIGRTQVMTRQAAHAKYAALVGESLIPLED